MVKLCCFSILLWQLAHFHCGSWRFFAVAVGAFSLWQLANISYNCQYLHNTTIDGAKLQNRLYRIMVSIITKKTPKNQD
jgi:hypothetical protein